MKSVRIYVVLGYLAHRGLRIKLPVKFVTKDNKHTMTNLRIEEVKIAAIPSGQRKKSNSSKFSRGG